MPMPRYLVAVILLSALAAGAGCSSESWRNRRLSGPEIVAMAFDPNDADRRREGIAILMEKDWGLREPHLQGYALILKTDRAPLVRSVAARALGKAGNPGYAGALAAALADPVPTVRWDVAVALDTVHGDPAILPLCDAAISDPSVDVRIAAAHALAYYRRADAARALAKCLNDDNFGVRDQAHKSLIAITGTDMGFDGEKWMLVTKGDLSPAPAAARQKPWWDWMGVAKKPTASPPPPAQDAGEIEPPWWDWVGVTQKQSPDGPLSPLRPPARPWWDWAGVTPAPSRTGGVATSRPNADRPLTVEPPASQPAPATSPASGGR